VVGITTNLTAATLAVGSKQTFTATITNTTNTIVTWSVQEGAAGGSITTGGVYTAPNTAGTYHVIVTSKADTTKSVTISITVHLVVSVTPTTHTLTLLGKQTFTAGIVGSANTAVTWSVEEGAAGGTVTANGVYTAPNVPGTYHVIVTSQADATQQASAAIVVQAGSASGTIQ
jgi:hypothetical protein